MADQNARQDDNKAYALIAHTGTAGTAETIRVVADGSGNLMVNVAAGEVIAVSAGTITAGTINKGTISAGTIDVLKAGTITEILNGSIVVTAGTVTTTASDIPGGTIDAITALPDLPGGTLDAIPNIPGGTIGEITNGSIVVTSATISAGTMQFSGTPSMNVVSGSVAVTAGTIGAFTADIPGGTVDLVSNVAFGTIKSDGRVARNVLSYATTFGATAAAYATLVGSAVVGAGTYTWVNDVAVVNTAGTVTCTVGFGTALNGTSVLAKGAFAANGGIQKSFPLPVNAGMTNQDLVCHIGAAGTVDVSVSYFISA